MIKRVKRLKNYRKILIRGPEGPCGPMGPMGSVQLDINNKKSNFIRLGDFIINIDEISFCECLNDSIILYFKNGNNDMLATLTIKDTYKDKLLKFLNIENE